MGNFEEAVRTLSDLEIACAEDEESADLTPTYLELSKVYMRLGLLQMAEQYRVKAMEGLSSVTGVEEDGDTIHQKAHATLSHAELNSLQGKHREAIQLCEEALCGAAQIDAPAFLASCHMLAADSNFALNNRQECLDHCKAALGILDQQPDGSIAELLAFYQAKLFKFSGRLPEALKQFENCYFARRKVEMVDGQAEALMEMGAIELFLQRPEHAVPFLERASRMYTRTNNACSLVKSLNLLGEAYRLSGRYNEATEALEQAETREGMLQEAAESRWETLMLRSRISLGKGDLADATASLKQAQKSLPQNPRSVMKVLHLKSILELRHGDFGAALSYVETGTEAACKAEDRLCSLRFLEQQIFVYLRLGNVQGAEKLASWLLETAQDFDMTGWTGKALLLEALVHQARGNVDEALRLFNEAEGVLLESDGERDVALLNYYQGLFHFHARDFDQAWLRLQEAMYLAEKLKLSYLRPQILCALGQLESTIEDGDAAKAENLLRRAERIAREKSYADVKWRVRYHLGRFLSSQGSKKEATKCLGKALGGLTWVLSRTPAEYHDSLLATFPAVKLRSHVDLSKVALCSTAE
jgi:tetratricopeptide (TPR) repeat protein